MGEDVTDFREGPPRYYRGICVRYFCGFIGGPTGFEETTDPEAGPVIINRMEHIMDAQEIIERIMSAHWDMPACRCWLCEAGRQLGFGAREQYLPHRDQNAANYSVPPFLYGPRFGKPMGFLEEP